MGLDWKGEYGCGEWERAEGNGGIEREKSKKKEGRRKWCCSSVSALWSRASWDSRTLCQDSTLQNQSLSAEHKEKDTYMSTHMSTHMFTLTNAQTFSFEKHTRKDFHQSARACDCRVWCRAAGKMSDHQISRAEVIYVIPNQRYGCLRGYFCSC